MGAIDDAAGGAANAERPIPTPHSGIDLAMDRSTPPDDWPNVILLVGDDLDARSIAHLPRMAALGDQGATFSRFYATTPICCPSRASILRGQYAHNHGVLKNNGRDGAFQTFYLRGNEASTLATWLRDAGYRTGLVGKYLNGYPRIQPRFFSETVPADYVPPGWDEWYAQMDRGAFTGFNYELNENGRVVAYGDRPDDYVTDVLSRLANRFVESAAGTGRPFFLYLATTAPHWPAVPAPRHADAFPNVDAPRPPSFDEADVSDKPSYLRAAPRLSDDQVRAIDDQHRRRLQSLLAVDELVARLVETLRVRGVLDRTYLFLTSDHGWHQGEHRLPFGKHTPYEESIRAPLVVRGPSVPPGRVVDSPSLNIDLAPTIAALAGACPPEWVDGRSLLPVLDGDGVAAWRRAFLVEYLGLERVLSYPDLGEMPRVPTYGAVRSADHLYADYGHGGREVYDLRRDPWQLDNEVERAEPALVASLASRLAELRVCSGKTCRVAEDAPLDSVRDVVRSSA